MSSGWVKLHRKILDNDIFKNDKLFRVFMYLLLKASHSERDQLIGDSIVNLKAGQWATGRKAISRDTGLTEQNVRTAISKLEKLGILTIKVTVKYSVFSISNWDCYQQDNQQVTNNQPTSNQQVTTINNVKNEKNEKKLTKRFTPPTDIETVSYFEEKGSTASEAEKFWFFYDSKNWMVGKSKMKRWQSAASGWIKRNKTESKDIMQISNDSDWHLQDQGF